MSLKRTPFYSNHVALGARMVPFAGFEMPVQYAGVKPEHHAVRTAVGVFDVSHMGEVFVRGPHALAALQHLMTNDLSRLQDGEALYTVMCNDEGGVVDDLVIIRFSAEEYLVCVNAANQEKDFSWMVAHNPHGAEIVDESEAWVQLAIQGRHAVATVQALTDLAVDDLANYSGRAGITVAGIEGCIVSRTGYTGEDGVEIFAPADTGVALWQAVLDAGAEHGIMPVGLAARDTLRLEAGMHLYGHELDDTTSPWQAGLARVVKMDKAGGFVGQDALARRKGNEARRLVRLVLDGKRIGREGMPVTKDGDVVGTVCSGTRSPTLGHGIAMAYVDRAHVKAGTDLVIDVRGREAPCRVVRGIFYKRDYQAAPAAAKELPMEFPADLKYTAHDEWIRLDGDVVTLGISAFAQDALGELVHVEFLQEVGDTIDAGDAVAEVESVKAVAEVYCPAGGEVIEVNEALEDEEDTVNSDPYGAGWLVKVRISDADELGELLDVASYQQKIDEA